MKTTSPFSVLKTLFFASFFSAFLFGSTGFAAVYSVENISEKVKGDRLSLSDVNSILGTIRGFSFDDSTNFVGIGTDAPVEPLEVSGNVLASGYLYISDQRLKKNIQSLSAPLEKIQSLRGVSFDWNRDDFPSRNFDSAPQIGFIAQEVESVFPEVVSTDANGIKSLNYAALVAPLVESVQTLSVQNDLLRARIERLESDFYPSQK